MNKEMTETNLADAVLSNSSTKEFSVALEKRKIAFEHFQKLGLPDKKNEDYRFTPITSVLEKNFNWEIQNHESKFDSINPFLIDSLATHVIVLLNGHFSKEHSILHPEEGVTIQALTDSFQSKNEMVDAYFDQLISKSDPFAVLNSALWQDGIFIHVSENVKAEKPILILHLHDSSTSQSISHTKSLVVVESGASLSLIEKSSSVGKENIFHTFSEEIFIQENASLDYVKIQNDEGNLYHVATSAIHQSNKSKLNTFTMTMNGKLIRNNFNIVIDGENCESHFYGLYLLHGNTIADNHTVVDHQKPNSFSNELYKGVMDGNSKAIFNGKIFVRPQAQKTNAFQSNRNILLTDTATINTKPQLEIWADDVKCSHGCTTGQLDEEALFYLQSRGIPEQTAKAMLLYDFAGETLTPIKNESLKIYLNNLISERLQKNY